MLPAVPTVGERMSPLCWDAHWLISAAGLRAFWLVVSAYKFCGSQFSELRGVFAEGRVEFPEDCFQFTFWRGDRLGAEFADAFVESWEVHKAECYRRKRNAIGGSG